MIICNSCGNAMEDNVRFCPECGTPNPTTHTGEPTVLLPSAPTSRGPVSEPTKFQSPPTPEGTVPFDQVTAGNATPIRNSPAQQAATTSNRTPLIIVAAVVSALLLLLLGAVASRRLLSDNKPAERTVEATQTPTPSPTAVSTPEPRKKKIQVTLKAGQSSEPFSFYKNGDVAISGNKIGTCKSDNKYEAAAVYISGPS